MIECKVNAACKIVLRVDSVLMGSRGTAESRAPAGREHFEIVDCVGRKPTFGQPSRKGWIQLQGCPGPHPFTQFDGLANT